jgi:hypothetical protein
MRTWQIAFVSVVLFLALDHEILWNLEFLNGKNGRSVSLAKNVFELSYDTEQWKLLALLLLGVCSLVYNSLRRRWGEDPKLLKSITLELVGTAYLLTGASSIVLLGFETLVLLIGQGYEEQSVLVEAPTVVPLALLNWLVFGVLFVKGAQAVLASMAEGGKSMVNAVLGWDD